MKTDSTGTARAKERAAVATLASTAARALSSGGMKMTMIASTASQAARMDRARP